MKNDDNQYSSYQMIRWEDYKKDFKSPEGNNSFWVRVQKSELADFLGAENIDLDTQLFGFEWPTRDEFRFLLLSKNAKAFKNFQSKKECGISLGHKDRLMFQDFQVHFEVERRELLAVLHEDISDIEKFLKNILKIAIIPEESGKKTLEEILARFGIFKPADPITLRECNQPRRIYSKLTLEDFIFSPDRIAKYCTACPPEELDFLLTYRNSDIVRALKEETLRDYLTKKTYVELDPSVQQMASLLYPSYLRSYMDFYDELQKDFSDDFYLKRSRQLAPIDEITKKVCERGYDHSQRCRKEFRLDDLWNVLCIYSYDTQDVTERFKKFFCERQDDLVSLPKRIEELYSTFHSFRYGDSEISLSCEEIARSYERSNIQYQSSEFKESWYIEDIIRYFSTTQNQFSSDTIMLQDFLFRLEKEFKECFNGIPRCDVELNDDRYQDLYRQIKHFIGDITPENNYYAEYQGVLPDYFLLSTWDNSLPIDKNATTIPITDRSELPLDYRAKIYKSYLGVNETLTFILSRISCLPIHREMRDLVNFFSDVEYKYLRELFEDDKLSDDDKLKFIDSIIERESPLDYPLPFRRLPRSHRDLLTDFERKIAEKQLAEAEAREKTQREVFTDMNHSIKNLITSVTRNLSQLDRGYLDDEARKIALRRARQGAVLVGQITEAITYSYRRIGNDWKTDLLPANATNFVWNDIISDALFFSIPNMFIDTYEQYQQESSAYFPSQEDLLSIEKSWVSLPDAEARIEWIRSNMFDLELYVEEDVYKLKIGRLYATHLFILFNELFLNAIKAAAHVLRDQRSLSLRLQIKGAMLVVDLSNSCNRSENPSMRSHGFGQLIIENYRKMFQIDDFSGELLPDKNQYRQHFSIQIISKS